jgi:hypothetical protein
VFEGVVVLYESNYTSLGDFVKRPQDPTNWSDVLVFTTPGQPQPFLPNTTTTTATYVSDTDNSQGQTNGITDADLAAAGLGFLHVSDLNQPNTVYVQEDSSMVQNRYLAQYQFGPPTVGYIYDIESDPAESDFMIFPPISNLTLDQGALGNVAIEAMATAGKGVHPIFLTAGPVPAGATTSFSQAVVSSSPLDPFACNCSSTLTINAGTAAPGTYGLTIQGVYPIQGTLNLMTRTATLNLTITAPVPTSPKTWGSLKARYH